MPVNKAARIRFEILDECLRNTMHKWTKKKLLEVLNNKLRERIGDSACISLSQIRNDLTNMQTEYGAPIESKQVGVEVIYYYEDPEFSIVNLPLDEEDISRLNEVVHIMQQIKGFTIADELSGIVQRLENKVKLSSDNKKPVIAFENPPAALGADNLGDIYESIINKQVLKICYKHFYASESNEQKIHPYFLKEYNNRWFLFGWSEKNNRVEIMALDRMESIKATSGKYKENDVFEPETYFSDIIGVTRKHNAKIEEIELLFSKERAPYIVTKKLHDSQQVITKRSGKVLIKLKLVLNKELNSLILSFGSDVEVLKPKVLREQICEMLLKSIESYKC